MTKSPKEFAEIGELTARLSERTISPEEFVRLEKVLSEDADARAFYCEYMALGSELSWTFGGAAVSREPQPRRTPRARIVAWIAVAAAVLVAVLATMWRRSEPPPAPGNPGVPPAVAVAQVVELSGHLEVMTSSGPGVPATVGQRILDGQTLSTGGDESSAVLEYDDRTRLQISPYTVVRLSRDAAGGKKVFFSTGVLRADVTPQPQDRPLIVTTPQAEILVRGTRFLVSSAAPDTTRVDLETGELQVVRPSDGRSLELGAGSYVVIQAGLEPVVVRPAPKTLTQPQRQLGFGSARSVICLPEGKGFLAATSRLITFWDAAGSPQKFPARDRKGESGLVACSLDGTTLALSTKEGDVVLWDVDKRQELRTIAGRGKEIRALAISPEGARIAAVDSDPARQAVIHLWNASDGSVKELQVEAQSVRCLAWSPDGGTLAAGTGIKGKGNHRIYLFEATTGALLGTLPGHAKPVEQLVFSPDGRRLATSGQDGLIHLWNLRDREIERTLQGHERQVGALAFSPDGRLIAGGTGEGQVWLWQVSTGDVHAVIKAGRHPLWSLAFSSDGKTLATVGCNTQVMLWDVP